METVWIRRAGTELSTNIPLWWSPCNELPHFACSHEEKLKHQNSSVDFNSKRFLLCFLQKGALFLGFDPFFRSGRHRDVNHCHKAGLWGVGGWHDSCRAVRRLLFLCRHPPSFPSPPPDIFPLERVRCCTDRPGLVPGFRLIQTLYKCISIAA